MLNNNPTLDPVEIDAVYLDPAPAGRDAEERCLLSALQRPTPIKGVPAGSEVLDPKVGIRESPTDVEKELLEAFAAARRDP